MRVPEGEGEKVHEFAGVSVKVIQTLREFRVVLTSPIDGSTVTFVVESYGGHIGCSMLDVEKYEAPKYEPDWIDLEQHR